MKRFLFSVAILLTVYACGGESAQQGLADPSMSWSKSTMSTLEYRGCGYVVNEMENGRVVVQIGGGATITAIKEKDLIVERGMVVKIFDDRNTDDYLVVKANGGECLGPGVM